MSVRKYSIVGLINTFIGLLVIYIAKWVGLGEVVSNFTGYLCGILIGFGLNSRWTFEYKGNQLRAFIIFVLVIVVAYLSNLSVVMMTINNTNINTYVAQSFGIVPYTIITYLGSKYIAFSK